MKKIKRLELTSWMKNYANGCLGNFKHEFARLNYERQAAHFEKTYPQVGVSNYPNGCYQVNDQYFFVYEGYAFLYNKEDFNYRLNHFKNLEKVADPAKLAALIELEKAVYGKAREESLELMRAWQLNQVARDSRKHRAAWFAARSKK